MMTRKLFSSSLAWNAWNTSHSQCDDFCTPSSCLLPPSSFWRDTSSPVPVSSSIFPDTSFDCLRGGCMDINWSERFDNGKSNSLRTCQQKCEAHPQCEIWTFVPKEKRGDSIHHRAPLRYTNTPWCMLKERSMMGSLSRVRDPGIYSGVVKNQTYGKPLPALSLSPSSSSAPPCVRVVRPVHHISRPRIIYHLHFRKAGGTTMRKYLLLVAASFAQQNVTLILLNSENEVFDASSLCDAPPLTVFVTTIRHPIDRIVSLFHYEGNPGSLRRNNKIEMANAEANSKNSSIWHRWLDRGYQTPNFHSTIMRNYYTRRLTGLGRNRVDFDVKSYEVRQRLDSARCWEYNEVSCYQHKWSSNEGRRAVPRYNLSKPHFFYAFSRGPHISKVEANRLNREQLRIEHLEFAKRILDGFDVVVVLPHVLKAGEREKTEKEGAQTDSDHYGGLARLFPGFVAGINHAIETPAVKKATVTIGNQNKKGKSHQDNLPSDVRRRLEGDNNLDILLYRYAMERYTDSAGAASASAASTTTRNTTRECHDGGGGK